MGYVGKQNRTTRPRRVGAGKVLRWRYVVGAGHPGKARHHARICATATATATG